jgi:hypothetical protein
VHQLGISAKAGNAKRMSFRLEREVDAGRESFGAGVRGDGHIYASLLMCFQN